MFHVRKKKQAKAGLNKRGFTLVEVLIAIGILAIITIPLAMNMISSSQINSKAKQMSSANDLTTSIMEVLQIVDLSDIMADINGYSTDEYGTQLNYKLTSDALGGYTIENAAEVLLKDGGKYEPVTKQETVIQDYLVTSSVHTRDTGDVKRTYFVGQDNDEYYFILSNVRGDGLSVDVVARIKALQTLNIVNITSMMQSEVATIKQDARMNAEVAAQFKKANALYVLEGNTDAAKSDDWFLKNMERTITIRMDKDRMTDAVAVTVVAEYTVEEGCVKESDRKITKTLGSFTTNSTAEFAYGIYVYYYPLNDFEGTTTPRDHFVVYNENELGTPIFLVAMSNDAAIDYSTITNYNPTIEVNELSDQVYQDVARTIICSNVPNDRWEKSLYPLGRDLEIRTLGNATNTQTLYEITIEVYRHRKASYDAYGVFTPRTNDLLVNVSGSFLDTSQKVDIDSDTTTGLTPTVDVAYAGVYTMIYNGQEQLGVFGSGVNWRGVTKATNAGVYTAFATPQDGFSWEDGTRSTKTFTWEIQRAKIADYTIYNHTYAFSMLTGAVAGLDPNTSQPTVKLYGTLQAQEAGYYTIWAVPNQNYAWEDGTTTARSAKWRISPKELTITWGTGYGVDTWEYDGKLHYATVYISGIVDGDTCDVTLKSNSIREVGQKTATISSISNKNYSLPSTGTTHVISVTTADSAYVEWLNVDDLVYDGTVKDVVGDYRGVYFQGTQTAKDVGTYTVTAYLQNGWTWPGGGTDPVEFKWEITPRVVELEWGTLEWYYDGRTHATTCTVTNLLDGDTCTVDLLGNSIKDVGTAIVIANGLTNKNYQLPTTGITETLVVHRARAAYYQTFDFQYDGNVHVGVTGSFIKRNGTYATSEVRADSEGNVAYYYVDVVPMANYCWADNGGTEKRTVLWKITPIADAWYRITDVGYSGEEEWGLWARNHITWTGYASGTEIGQYSVTVTPETNHAWANTGKMNSIELKWEIVNNLFTKPILEETVFSYTGEVIEPQIMLHTLSEGYAIDGDLSATNVGTYTIRAYLLDPDTAQWGDGTTEDVLLTWHIVKKQVTITWNTNTWTYDGTEKTGTATIGNIGDDDVYFIYDDNVQTAAGTYTITITGLGGADASQYSLPSSGCTSTMTINGSALGVDWGTLEFDYDGTAKTVLATPTGIGTDEVTFVYETNSNIRTNAGSQTVTIIGLGGADGDNYTLPANCTATMTINPRVIELDWGTTSWEYDGNYHTATATITNLVDGDTCNLTYYEDGNQSDSGPGEWLKEVTAVDNANYTFDSSAWVMLEVYKRTIEIVWGTTTWDYDGNEHTVIATVGNLVSGETCTIELSNASRTVAGSQTVTAAGLSGEHASQYQLPSDGNTATLIINGIDGVVETPPTAKTGLVYSGSAQQLIDAGSSSTGTVYYSLDGATWFLYPSSITGTNAGTYTVYYFSDGDNNHNDTEVESIEVTIAKAKAEFATTPSPNTREYNGQAQWLCSTGAALTDGTIMYKGGSNESYLTSVPTATNVGTYTVKCQLIPSDTTNYCNSDVVTITATITESTPTAYLLENGTMWFYDHDTQPSFSFTVKATFTGWDTATYNGVSDTPWYDYMDDIAYVYITDNVEVVSTDYWFSVARSLVNVQIGDGITVIGTSMFDTCEALESVDLGSGVTAIMASAFYKCEGLTSIVLPDALTYIDMYSFTYSGLTAIDIPDSVTYIGDSAFYYCSGLTSVTIGDGVATIHDQTFAHCEALDYVVLGTSVDFIWENAFEWAPITHMEFANTYGWRVTTDYNTADTGSTSGTSVSLEGDPEADAEKYSYYSDYYWYIP